jgi:hypothetical protein
MYLHRWLIGVGTFFEGAWKKLKIKIWVMG